MTHFIPPREMEGLQGSSSGGDVKNTEEGDDDDRQMDKRSFQREQFDIFKHNFREAYDEQYGAQELESTIKCAELKRAAINLVRRLRKAGEALEASNVTEPAVERVRTTRDALAILVKPTSGAATEFSATNIPLPHFNRDDIELLLGEDHLGGGVGEGTGTAHQMHIADNKSPEDAFHWIEDSNRTFQSRVQTLLAEGEDALRECGMWEESHRN